MRVLSDEKGFTFLEMCMVVAIIAILMVIAVPNYQSALANAQKKSCDANRRLIETQLDSYFLDNNKYPDGPDSTQIINTLITSKYLKDAPKCPSNKADYTVAIDKEHNTFTVTCPEPTHNTK